MHQVHSWKNTACAHFTNQLLFMIQQIMLIQIYQDKGQVQPSMVHQETTFRHSNAERSHAHSIWSIVVIQHASFPWTFCTQHLHNTCNIHGPYWGSLRTYHETILVPLTNVSRSILYQNNFSFLMVSLYLRVAWQSNAFPVAGSHGYAVVGSILHFVSRILTILF